MKRSALDERLATIRRTPAWRAYERVRDWYLDGPAASADASGYWQEELESLGFMLDASPLVIERLRHHMYPVTGIRPYDYRTGKERLAPKFAEKLEALEKLGGERLRVPEPDLLGGFGFELGTGRWNIDTLKYHEALVALELGAVLEHFRGADGRRVVWEIGAGWGGFAYQFHKLFPNVTYLIVDLPELFLFSVPYLQAAFPEASIHLHGDGEVDWDRDDFVLVPHSALDSLAPPRIDITINMVSFQEMTREQVEQYVRCAHEFESPFLYSLNRERSRYNDELDSVGDALASWYWVNEIPVLPVSYVNMLDKRPKKEKQGPEGDYRHLLGRRRLLT